MKDKMKEFVEKHKKAIIVIGTGAAVLTCGAIGYKLGIIVARASNCHLQRIKELLALRRS